MVKMTIIGNIGKNATMTETNGKKAINFSIAHNESYKDSQGNEISKTLWVNCTLWKENANIMQFLKAGAKVYIEGKPSVKTYKNNTGDTLAALEVRVDFLDILVFKSENKEEETEKQSNNDYSISENEVF